jgi:hypothetical protein
MIPSLASDCNVSTRGGTRTGVSGEKWWMGEGLLAIRDEATGDALVVCNSCLMSAIPSNILFDC